MEESVEFEDISSKQNSTNSPSEIKKRKATSAAWQYFEWRQDLQKYICKICFNRDSSVLKEYSQLTGMVLIY
jgi:hypothetical protein